MRKSLTLLPAGALAAAVLASACAPPPPPPPPPPTTTPGSTTCATPSSAKAGPDGADPISSWGVDGTANAAVVIGNVVYVGGSFNNAVSPTGQPAARANLAAFCLADGSLLNSFSANFRGGPVNALATDGTSLFVGGNFTTLNGAASNRLVKLNASSGARDTSFAPAPIPAPGAGGVTPPTDGVLALAYSSATGVLYAGGDFGKIGTGAGGGQSTVVDNAAGFTANGTLTSFTGGTDKKVESIAVSPDGQTIHIGGFFTTVHGQTRGQLARLDPTGLVGGTNLAIGAHVLDIQATSNANDIAVAVGAAVGGSSTGRRLTTFSGNTPILNDVNPKGDVNGVEVIGGLDYFGMSKGYGTNSGPNLVGVDPTQPVGSANYMPFSTTAVGGTIGIRGLAQSAGGARLVAVGDFTSVGTTGSLHGVAIFS